MHKKTIIIAGTVIFFLLVVSLALVLTSKKKPAPSAANSSEVISNNPSTLSNTATAPFSFPAKDADKMTLNTSAGDISANNIYKSPVENLSLNGVAFKDNPDYYMDFYPDSQGFTIIIYNPDFQAARLKAEQDFVSTLGITEDQACKLRVAETTPVQINSQSIVKNFGLSFCK